jgi:hypothetical protein
MRNNDCNVLYILRRCREFSPQAESGSGLNLVGEIAAAEAIFLGIRYHLIFLFTGRVHQVDAAGIVAVGDAAELSCNEKLLIWNCS